MIIKQLWSAAGQCYGRDEEGNIYRYLVPWWRPFAKVIDPDERARALEALSNSPENWFSPTDAEWKTLLTKIE